MKEIDRKVKVQFGSATHIKLRKEMMIIFPFKNYKNDSLQTPTQKYGFGIMLSVPEQIAPNYHKIMQFLSVHW